MNPRFALMKAALVALMAPSVACGGETSSPDAPSGAGGGAGTAGVGGGGAAGLGGGAGGASTVPAKFGCIDPVAVIVDGKPTGFERCANGVVRRPEVVTCPSLLPRATTCNQGSPGGVPGCSKDSDCTEKPYGSCDAVEPGAPFGCSCSYGCTSDAECEAGAICVCGDPIGRCVKSTCVSDASCPTGVCASLSSCSLRLFQCQTPADECAVGDDCPKTGSCESVGGKRVCAEIPCPVPGRPIWVGMVLRVSLAVARDDWA